MARTKFQIPKDLTHLQQFFACYFHDTWTDEYTSHREAISDYLRGTQNDHIRNAMTELEWLLVWLKEQDADDLKIGDILYDSLQLNYYPPGDGTTYEDWLTFLHQQLLARLASDATSNDPPPISSKLPSPQPIPRVVTKSNLPRVLLIVLLCACFLVWLYVTHAKHPNSTPPPLQSAIAEPYVPKPPPADPLPRHCSVKTFSRYRYDVVIDNQGWFDTGIAVNENWLDALVVGNDCPWIVRIGNQQDAAYALSAKDYRFGSVTMCGGTILIRMDSNRCVCPASICTMKVKIRIGPLGDALAGSAGNYLSPIFDER
jgi:contact-dependent growth inhibition (CDI) system CdiI-like immunity protein